MFGNNTWKSYLNEFGFVRCRTSWNRERCVIRRRKTPSGLKNRPSIFCQMLRTTWSNYRYESCPIKPRSLTLSPGKHPALLTCVFQSLVEASSKRVVHLASQWEKHRAPLIDEHRRLKELCSNREVQPLYIHQLVVRFFFVLKKKKQPY